MKGSESFMKTGDIVKVTRNDGRIYECFVVQDFSDKNLFCGKVLETYGNKVPSTTWSRYGMSGDCICQLRNECKSVEMVNEGTKIIVEDMNDTAIFTNTYKGKNLTFCLSEDFGGWSEERDTSTSLYESVNRAISKRSEVSRNAC